MSLSPSTSVQWLRGLDYYALCIESSWIVVCRSSVDNRLEWTIRHLFDEREVEQTLLVRLYEHTYCPTRTQIHLCALHWLFGHPFCCWLHTCLACEVTFYNFAIEALSSRSIFQTEKRETGSANCMLPKLYRNLMAIWMRTSDESWSKL